MINIETLRTAYNKFYKSLSNYLLDFETVANIAELEIEVYKAFPDKKQAIRYLSKVFVDIKEKLKDDERLNETYNTLKDLLDSEDQIFNRVKKLNEVNV